MVDSNLGSRSAKYGDVFAFHKTSTNTFFELYTENIYQNKLHVFSAELLFVESIRLQEIDDGQSHSVGLLMKRHQQRIVHHAQLPQDAQVTSQGQLQSFMVSSR